MSKRVLLTSALVLTFAAAQFALPARAQITTFPDILGDIFKGGTPSLPPLAGVVYIENIPVQVSFDSRPGWLAPGSMVIVTAIAPPNSAPQANGPLNGSTAGPRIMGETRLLISALTAPLQMVVAVPSDVARDTPYAEITARIVDAQGNITHEIDAPGRFDGNAAPFLNLRPVSGAVSRPQPISGTPPSGVYVPLSGEVSLLDSRPLMRGAVLVVRVTETALAGGVSNSAFGELLTEERIALDGKTAPFTFEFNVPTGANNRLDEPQAEIFIEDWAGRKTHITPRPVSIFLVDGQPSKLNVRLDNLTTGQDAVDPQRGDYTPPPGVMRQITGEAQFDAYKGLPRGCYLLVKLRDAVNYDEILSETRITLDGRSGYIPFLLDVENERLTARANPLIEATIIDEAGLALFTTLRLPSLGTQGLATTVRLEATPSY